MARIRLPGKREKEWNGYPTSDMHSTIFDLYRDLSPDVQFKMVGNYVELSNEKYKVYSTEKNNVIYEIDLSVEGNEQVAMIFYRRDFQKIGGIFEVGPDGIAEIKLTDLVAACAEGRTEGVIFSYQEKELYNELFLDIELNGNIVSIKNQIRFDKPQTREKEAEAQEEKSYVIRGRKRKLRRIDFKGRFGFDVQDYDIRDLLVELQKCDIDYTIEFAERWMSGYVHEVFCYEVKTKWFMIVLEDSLWGTSFLEAHFSLDILKSTYCTNHLGQRFNVYERLINSKDAYTYLDLGVDDVWCSYNPNREYPVSLGYEI